MTTRTYSTAVGTVNAMVEIILRDVEPHTATVKLVNYSLAEKLFRPESAQVSWTQLPGSKELLNVHAFVHGRYPRNNSGKFETGGAGVLEFLAEFEEDVEQWPAYVQAAVNAALATVRMP